MHFCSFAEKPDALGILVPFPIQGIQSHISKVKSNKVRSFSHHHNQSSSPNPFQQKKKKALVACRKIRTFYAAEQHHSINFQLLAFFVCEHCLQTQRFVFGTRPKCRIQFATIEKTAKSTWFCSHQ